MVAILTADFGEIAEQLLLRTRAESKIWKVNIVNKGELEIAERAAGSVYDRNSLYGSLDSKRYS